MPVIVIDIARARSAKLVTTSILSYFASLRHTFSRENAASTHARAKGICSKVLGKTWLHGAMGFFQRPFIIMVSQGRGVSHKAMGF